MNLNFLAFGMTRISSVYISLNAFLCVLCVNIYIYILFWNNLKCISKHVHCTGSNIPMYRSMLYRIIT